MTDSGQIRTLVDARNAAIGRGDAPAAIAPLAADIVAYTLQPPLAYVGAQARDLAGFERWLATWAAPPQVALHDPTVLVDGDLAIVFGVSRMRGTSNGQASDLWYRATIGLQRRDGNWTIVHEHESVPFLMDGSDKAALDLKP